MPTLYLKVKEPSHIPPSQSRDCLSRVKKPPAQGLKLTVPQAESDEARLMKRGQSWPAVWQPRYLSIRRSPSDGAQMLPTRRCRTSQAASALGPRVAVLRPLQQLCEGDAKLVDLVQLCGNASTVVCVLDAGDAS